MQEDKLLRNIFRRTFHVKYPIGTLGLSKGLLYNGSVIPDEIRKDVGKGGEDIACQFLLRKGYKIIDRNYRRKWGEIDIIALKDGVVRFVEVKAVSRDKTPDFSREMDYRPEELVHKSKLRKVARTAALYMEERKDDREFQIDVVGIVMNELTRTARCRLFEQALEENL